MPNAEPKDLLLLVWVHGFKGNDVTFESFPERISHLLATTHPSLKVESRVFPAYQTRGELTAATLAFVDWLTELVVNLENDHGAGGGAGKAKVVLMGHSMGGLLIADAARDIASNTREGEMTWPRIVGILAFDTPYLGLHPPSCAPLQKHHLSQAASYVDQARSIASTVGMLSPMALGLGFGKFGKKSEETPEAGPSGTSRSTAPINKNGKGKQSESAVLSETTSSTTESTATTTSNSFWSKIPAIVPPSTKTMYGLGAAALGAVALGTAYYRREDFVTGWKWGYDHMTFVRNLWDDDGMKGRLVAIHELIIGRKVVFHNFYTHLPPNPPTQLVSRTFAILPPMTHPLYKYFNAASNNLAKDEVSAHMGMFNPKTNDGFYDLGLEVVRAIGEKIEEEGVGRSDVKGLDEVLAELDDLEADEETIPAGKAGWGVEKDEKGNEIWVEK
ncbi:uncharacterized protein I206_104375 [Kwoniella pini CBS 10737]|uniref:DUF676 domain-containing protein n=1 Tax=Kwoniella pini CBS 10737 TaxID=1296096 RepID=A0A1B9I1W7_9TREE|nr:uncharacterized protein I206_04045 [Kwoniella pini CBS 10737]OCF49524.1 hypothetical protein I206_04045 [Kwoniella pini CBS 10737]